MQQVRGLLEPLAAELGGRAGRAGPILDRSEQAYLCLYLPGVAQASALPAQGAARPAAELALTGRWSTDLLSAGLDSSSGWVRHEAQRPSSPYWSSRRSPLEVGSPARGLLLAASGRPGALQRMMTRRLSQRAGPVETARAGDPRVDAFLSGAVLYACLPSRSANSGAGSQDSGEAAGPGGAAGEAAGLGGLPVRELWLAARRQGTGYELDALAALAGAQSPPSERAFSALVRLALASWLRKAGVPGVADRLRAVQVGLEEDRLSARGLRLSEAELLALLRGGLPAPAEEDNARSGD